MAVRGCRDPLHSRARHDRISGKVRQSLRREAMKPVGVFRVDLKQLFARLKLLQHASGLRDRGIFVIFQYGNLGNGVPGTASDEVVLHAEMLSRFESARPVGPASSYRVWVCPVRYAVS